MKYLFTLFVLWALTFGAAAQQETYEGTIGNYSIVLEFYSEYSDDTRANYFYKAQLKNVHLEGTIAITGITFYELYSNKEDKKELFTLKQNGNTLEGTWQHNGKTLPVTLQKSTLNVEDYRTKHSVFVRDSVVSYGKKELVWLHEKYSKQKLFRLGNGFSKTQRDSINPKLDKLHLSVVLDDFYCGYVDFFPEVSYVSDKYLSISGFSSTYCWGAHPNHGVLAYNFNLRTGQTIDSIQKVYPNLNYYSKIKAKHKDVFDEDLQEVEGGRCNYYDKWYWKYATWVFTKEGIEFTPSFPHAMTPCEEPFLLTYKELENN